MSIPFEPPADDLGVSPRTGCTRARSEAVADGLLAAARRWSTPRCALLGDGWGRAASWHRPVFAGGPPMVPGLRVESVTWRAAGTNCGRTGWWGRPRDPVSPTPAGPPAPRSP
ncbi:hypothetical protein [Streptomyces marokkonensis]|uniref:hypothetical protein n=1 Tax=Streptomyces marokkonensis TaxID=324855 RepID=UPI0011F1147E